METLTIVGVSSLRAAADVVMGAEPPPLPVAARRFARGHPEPDLADIRGHATPLLALQIAAAGGHNLLLEGAPGTGKTMLARRLPGILPALAEEEALEVTRIHSVVGLLPREHPLVVAPPFRAPHHSSSMPAIVGGGSGPSPGEASLAHPRVRVCYLNASRRYLRPHLV